MMGDRRGFTVVELLASLALAGLLMVAAMGATRSLSESAGRMDLAEDFSPEMDRVVDRIERELLQSHRWEFADGQLLLTGPLTRRTPRGPVHDPAHVRYDLIDLDGRRVLRRTQTRLLDRTDTPEEVEGLLLSTQGNLSLSVVGQAATATPLADGGVNDSEPTHVELILVRDGQQVRRVVLNSERVPMPRQHELAPELSPELAPGNARGTEPGGQP